MNNMIDRRTLLRAGGAAGLGLAALGLLGEPVLAAASSQTEAAGHWDTVPLYGQFSYRRDFSSDELQFLADHYPTFTFEKWQGVASHRWTEPGTEVAFNGLKQKSPATRVLYYWNGAVMWNTAYRSLQTVPDSFKLRTTTGALWNPRPDLPERRATAYDLSRADVRAWWLETVLTEVDRVGYDGLFIDGIQFYVEGRTTLMERTVGKDKASALRDGITQLLNDLRDRLPSGKQLVHNRIDYAPEKWANGGLHMLGLSDGVMLERFSELSPADRIGQLGLLDEVVRQDKMLMFHASQDLEISLAAFLISAGPRSYFHYARGWHDDVPSLQLQEIPVFREQLGAPLWSAIRDGDVYTRAFEHAEVYLNLRKSESRIVWSI